jgi:DNA-binding NarL/FixJ family response regulator
MLVLSAMQAGHLRMSPIPIIFLDPNTTFRRLVVRVLRRHFAADITLIADHPSWPIDEALAPQPQAVLFGLGMNALVEPQTIAGLHAVFPGSHIVILGHLDELEYRTAAFAAGAAAFIAKDALATELVPVLRRLVDGQEDHTHGYGNNHPCA